MPATYEPIATTTITTTTTGITFSSIPATYTDLVLVLSLTTSTEDASVNLRFNGDTATNYSYTNIYGRYATSVASERGSSTAQIVILGAYYGTSTTIPTLARVNIFNYAGSTNKTVLSEATGDKNGTGEVGRWVGLWRNTAAITSLTIQNTVLSGTTMTLYGIKAA